jgi:hypothetical protein
MCKHADEEKGTMTGTKYTHPFPWVMKINCQLEDQYTMKANCPQIFTQDDMGRFISTCSFLPMKEKNGLTTKKDKKNDAIPRI